MDSAVPNPLSVGNHKSRFVIIFVVVLVVIAVAVVILFLLNKKGFFAKNSGTVPGIETYSYIQMNKKGYLVSLDDHSITVASNNSQWKHATADKISVYQDISNIKEYKNTELKGNIPLNKEVAITIMLVDGELKVTGINYAILPSVPAAANESVSTSSGNELKPLNLKMPMGTITKPAAENSKKSPSPVATSGATP